MDRAPQPPPLHVAIDIGTNTLLAFVARADERGAPARIADYATITRLGEGVDRARRLAPAAMDRALTALAEFAARARALGAARFAAVATSAVRDADNGGEFVARARAIVGPDVEVISGAREAELTFAGASAGTGVADGTAALVFDVGGGSTEVIAGALGAPPRTRASIDVGSVRLTERAVRADPPAPAELARIEAEIARALAELGPAPAHDVLLGLAGTVTTLAAIDRREASLVGGAVHGVTLTRAAVERVFGELVARPRAAREQLPGLDPRRADVIIAGALIVRAVMAWAGRDELVVSDGGVRVGLWLERERQRSSAAGAPA